MPGLRQLRFRLQTARRHQPKHFLQACDQGFNVAPDPHESVFRAAHWPPFARVTFFSTRSPAQIVNNAAKIHYMSGGQLSVPLVIRGPGSAAHQLGAQHSQSLEA